MRVNDAAHLEGVDPTRASGGHSCDAMAHAATPLGGACATPTCAREGEAKAKETLGGLEPRPSLERAWAMAAKFEQLMAEAHASDDAPPFSPRHVPTMQ